MDNFQTPPDVAAYMVQLIGPGVKTVLEPTPGEGNLVKAIEAAGHFVHAPADFFAIDTSPAVTTDRRFDCVVTNPPFSAATAFGIPPELDTLSGMQIGYYILNRCMEYSDRVVALVPWLTLINSSKRMNHLKEWGLCEVIALPRETFKGSRVQTCILSLSKGHKGATYFKIYKATK